MTSIHHQPGPALHALVLVAANYLEQVAFYRDVMGIPMTADWGDAARFVTANGIELTLFARTHDPRSNARLEPRRHGISHLEFALPADQAADLGQRLTDLGLARVKLPDRAIDAADLGQRLTDLGHHTYGDNFVDCDGTLFHFA